MPFAFAQRRSVLVSVMTLGLLILAACGSVSTKPLTAAQIIQNSQNPSTLKDATFTLVLNATGSGSTLVFTGTGKVTRVPNRSDITLGGTFLGQTVTIEVITDGNDSYTQQSPSTTWNKTTGANSTSGLGIDTSSFTNFGNLQNPTLLGVETVNGYQAYHLKGSLSGGTPTPSLGTSTTQEDYWVRKDNFYPLKVVVSSTSTSSTSGTSSSSFTLTFKTWNTGLKINLPPPADVTTGP